MSLDYSTLKTQILSDAHRLDLGDAKAADFVRQAEGIIYRTLRDASQIARVNIVDADRVTVDEGFYNLPADFLEHRAIYLLGANQKALDAVSAAELRQVTGQSNVAQFSILSKTEIEFRGVPSDQQEMELHYFARPATLTNPTDDNAILIENESVYLDAGLAALYGFTQDLELRDTHAAALGETIETLNEQAGRLIGGANTHGYYCLSSFGSY